MQGFIDSYKQKKGVNQLDAGVEQKLTNAYEAVRDINKSYAFTVYDNDYSQWIADYPIIEIANSQYEAIEEDKEKDEYVTKGYFLQALRYLNGQDLLDEKDASISQEEYKNLIIKKDDMDFVNIGKLGRKSNDDSSSIANTLFANNMDDEEGHNSDTTSTDSDENELDNNDDYVDYVPNKEGHDTSAISNNKTDLRDNSDGQGHYYDGRDNYNDTPVFMVNSSKYNDNFQGNHNLGASSNAQNGFNSKDNVILEIGKMIQPIHFIPEDAPDTKVSMIEGADLQKSTDKPNHYVLTLNDENPASFYESIYRIEEKYGAASLDLGLLSDEQKREYQEYKQERVKELNGAKPNLYEYLVFEGSKIVERAERSNETAIYEEPNVENASDVVRSQTHNEESGVGNMLDFVDEDDDLKSRVSDDFAASDEEKLEKARLELEKLRAVKSKLEKAQEQNTEKSESNRWRSMQSGRFTPDSQFRK